MAKRRTDIHGGILVGNIFSYKGFKALLYSLQTHFRSFTVVGQYFEGGNVNTSYCGLNKKGARVEEGASVAHEFQ